MVVEQHGPVTRRPGTRYVADVRGGSSVVPIIIPFQFSGSQSYIIELGEGYARFYLDRQQVQVSHNVSTASWAGGTMTMTLATDHTWVAVNEGTEVVIAGVTPSGYNGTYTVKTVTGATTFTCDLVSDPGAYSSGGTVSGPYEISSPIDDPRANVTDWVQSADVLFIANTDPGLVELRRRSATDWGFTGFQYVDGPYNALNLDTTMTMSPSAQTGSINITASGHTPFDTTMQDSTEGTTEQPVTIHGRLVRIANGSSSPSTFGFAEISGFTSTTVAPATVINDFPFSASAQSQWQIQSIGWPDNHPKRIMINQDRLVLANGGSYPYRIWPSESDNITGFRPDDPEDLFTVVDTDSFQADVFDGEVNEIQWLRGVPQGIAVGTCCGEFLLAPGSNGVFTPTGRSVSRHTSTGSRENIRPIQTRNGDILFVQQSGQQINRLQFSIQTERFDNVDVSKFSEDILSAVVSKMTYQRDPFSLVWMLLENGKLACLTYEPAEDVVGWSKSTIGGTFSGSSAVVEDIEASHDESGDKPTDLLWMVVKRTVNSATVRYIEYVDDFFEDDGAASDAFFVDSGVTDTSGTTTISGLDHLEGETVKVLADGVPLSDGTVSSGSITIGDTYTTVQVGLGYTSTISTLPITLQGSQPDSAQKILRPERAAVRFLNSNGMAFGVSESDIESVVTGTTGVFTGVIEDMQMESRHERDNRLWLVQSNPQPMTVSAITIELETDVRR